MKSVERDDFIHGERLKTDGELAVEGIMMPAGSGGVIIIKPGVSLIRRVFLASDKVRLTI